MNTRGIKDKLHDWQEKATSSARSFGNTTDRYVRDNTWATIAIAAVAGCLLGYLLVGGREESED